MFTNPAMIRPISAIKSIPPILVKSFFVVEPIKAIVPKVPAVIKKVLAMAAEEKAAKIQPNVSPLRAAKAMNHIVAATSDSLSMREERYHTIPTSTKPATSNGPRHI